jgi:protein-L-isoaspartate(D-aspartate) O-methyltransferase
MLFRPKTDIICKSWQKVKRIDFVPEVQQTKAHIDQALPIGCGQTISQPSVVAFMMELLQPCLGGHYLDVGSGSGWTTALLSDMVGEDGKVWAMEINPELKSFGENNVSRYNFIEKGIAHFIVGDGWEGLPEQAPFDGILVSASASKMPEKLMEQLKIGGRMVIPIEESIWLVVRKGTQKYLEKEFPGFIFVPLL